MGLTYVELLAKIECMLDTKLNEKVNNFSGVVSDKLSVKLSELAAEFADLKDTNAKLIKINSALIEQNRDLRDLSSVKYSENDCDQAAADDEVIAEDDVTFELTDEPMNDPTKKYFDVLILSDSIYRHVGTECPKDYTKKEHCIISDFTIGNSSVLKVVCPGASCDTLLSKAAQLHSAYRLGSVYRFGLVVVHVGANYTDSSLSPYEISCEINGLLDELDALFQCKVTFSCILPQMDTSTLAGINFTNSLVDKFCMDRGYGLLQCNAFMRDARASLLARDGLHLSRSGVKALFASVALHIKYNFKYQRYIKLITQ